MLVLSDFHLGKGLFLEDGEANILEDFDEDEKFAEFLDHYSTGSYYFSHVHVVLNGDIFNLIQMDVNGEFTHYLGEEEICQMVQSIINGHPVFFQALRRFLSRPNKRLTYVIGNHDIGMIFSGAQDLVRRAVGSSDVEFSHQLTEYGVLVEHGHRFEPVNTVPRSKLLIKGPEGKLILNLPWASLFCIYLLPKLKNLRPFIDKIRPLSYYVKWTILHDFTFFMSLSKEIILYMIRTQFPPYGKYNKNFKVSWKHLTQIAIYPKYVTNAKRILATRPDVQVVIMGHTHLCEWRRFKDGRLYFNTGTWNHVPSVDQALHKNIAQLHYVSVEINPKTEKVQNAYLNVWHGKWRPYRQEVSVGGPSFN